MATGYSKKEVGERLKEFRLSLKRTQGEFAKEMDWDVNTYRKIENGVSLLTSDKAQKLHEKYDIDVQYMLTGERIDTDKFINEVWAVANMTQKKEWLIRFLEYFQKII